MKPLTKIVFFIFVFLGILHSQQRYLLKDLCNDTKTLLSYNPDNGYIFLSNTQNHSTVKMFITMPYISTKNKVFYFLSPVSINSTGQLILSEEAHKTLFIILTEQKPSSQKINTNSYKENFVISPITNTPEINTNHYEKSNQQISKQTPTNNFSINIKKIHQKDEIKKKMIYNISNEGFVPIDSIIIDPGHGGKDPGGVGVNGQAEKNIVLSVSKYLHQEFKKNSKLKTFITRNSDKFVTLEERAKISSEVSKKNNPIFLSIHANISLKKSVEGIEVYYQSAVPSDDSALDVERIENAGFDTADIIKTEALYQIISDLIRDGIQMESEAMAHIIANNMVKATGIKTKRVKRANFYVLKYNPVVSALIEIGYLSNKDEVKKLMQKDYQQKIAKGIYEGVIEFVNEYNANKGLIR